MPSYTDTNKEVGENIKNILSEEQLLEMEKNGTVPPNEEFFTPEDDIDRDKAMILNWIYPVGMILQFAEDIDPNALMPGQRWEKIKDKFLLASGDTYTNGATGGSANAVVVAHGHSYKAVTTLNANHTHNNFQNHQIAVAPDNVYWEGPYETGIYPTGVDGTGKNMPPYLVVNVWKRVE